ncbi:MAG: thiamine-monophosphate kinase, partial [Candidatus Saganbacteria bacterium]|nr:thiamine-monophosphate kinase [Candidatus Saganbacteria bacterium]
MKLKDIGEFALIERLSKIIGKTSGSVVLGIGDDAAALQMTNVKSFDRAQDGWNGELVEPCQMLPSDRARSLSSGRGRTEVLQHEVSNECKYLLITTDALIENVHFKLDKKNGRSPFFNLGCKALAINISDVAAMGGIPTYALVTIGANKNLSVRKIENLYRGINKLAKKHKIQIIGGDTVSSPKELIISITLLGEVEKENLLTRSGARVGNLILVTGSFGGSAAKKYVPSSFALRASEDKR